MYFFEQLGSGHSNSTGEVDGGLLGAEVGGLLFLATGVGVLSRSFVFLLESDLGGTNGVGELEPVELFPELLDAGVLPLPPLPLLAPPPFLNLLCTEALVSVKLLKSPEEEFVLFVARPRLALPFGVRESRSLVGESQNLGGAQSCRVQSNNVPT